MNSGKTFGSRAVEAAKKVTVEPFLFLVMFAYSSRIVTLQSLLHDRSCRILLNISLNVCDNLDDVENDVEQVDAVTFGNNLYNGFVMISTIPALFLAIFLGPWSDRYSRKYPLLIGSLGAAIDTSIQAVITSFPDASPYWYLASASITGCTGGMAFMMSGSYSYMSDITDERSRQTRFAILEFFPLMATPAGSFVGGQVFKAGGYLAVLIMTPCALGLAWLWMMFYVPETKQKKLDVSRKQIFRDLFRLDNIKASFKTCTQPRPGNLRMQIWLLVFISCSNRLIYMGALALTFPYVRRNFKWDIPRYSNTNSVFNLLSAALILTVVPLLNKKLKVREAVIGLIGVISIMAKMGLMSVTVHEYFVFGAMFAGSLYSCVGISVKSRISKLVSKQELGRVFSLLATCEAMMPVLGTLAMMQIYNFTNLIYPGLVYIVAGIFLIPAASIFIWMLTISKMSFAQYQDDQKASKLKVVPTITIIEISTRL